MLFEIEYNKTLKEWDDSNTLLQNIEQMVIYFKNYYGNLM